MSNIVSQIAPSKQRLALPTSVEPRQIRWSYTLGVIVIHALALLAFIPSYFSWINVAAAFGGIYVFGTFGINLCYHRLLTHRGFQCSKFLEHTFAILGVCCLQDTPSHWVAIHRKHHQHSDEQPDPHSPLVTFFWSHLGWLLYENRELHRLSMYEHYVKDLLRDPFYLRMERNYFWVWLNGIQWAFFLVLGFLIGWVPSGNVTQGLYAAGGMLVWGVFVRTVMVWHITWSVNSFTHLWGYRNYETGESSRNNIFVGIISNGEGWHNNHHAQPRSAAHGHHWWEFDVTYITIYVLQKMGLVWNVVMPNLDKSSKNAEE